MPTTSSKTITDLPTEVIDQIIISLGSEDGFMLSSPQMIKNIRLISHFFDDKQGGFYKTLIKRYYPSIQWAIIEKKYNEHLLPFSAIYGLLYRKIHDSSLSSLPEIAWLYKSLPQGFQYSRDLLRDVVKLGNLDFLKSLLNTYEKQWIQDKNLLKKIFNSAFKFNREHIVLYVLGALDNAYRNNPQRETIKSMLVPYLKEARNRAFIKVLKNLKTQWGLTLPLEVGGSLNGVLRCHDMLR